MCKVEGFCCNFSLRVGTITALCTTLIHAFVYGSLGFYFLEHAYFNTTLLSDSTQVNFEMQPGTSSFHAITTCINIMNVPALLNTKMCSLYAAIYFGVSTFVFLSFICLANAIVKNNASWILVWLILDIIQMIAYFGGITLLMTMNQYLWLFFFLYIYLGFTIYLWIVVCNYYAELKGDIPCQATCVKTPELFAL